MPSNSVILKVAGEGGSVALYGIREGNGWHFDLDFIDESVEPRAAVADSWEGALRLLDRYPWHLLTPVRVHPEFRERILEAVEKRCVAERDTVSASIQRWRTAIIDASEADAPQHSSDTWFYDD